MTRALKWWLALGFLLVFLAGAATGMFAAAWHARDSVRRHHAGMMGNRMRVHITRHLGLTPEQVQALDPIFDRTAKELQTIRQETGQRVAQTMETAHREFAPHLTPEQQARLSKMKMRHMKIKKMRRDRGPSPEP